MSRFKVGQEVKVKGIGSNPYSGPGYNSKMAQMEGKVYKIESIDTWVRFGDDSREKVWAWHDDWLELVEPKSITIKSFKEMKDGKV